MASYSNPQLRDKLAAEYVLGTLRGRARARFQSLLRYDLGLRRLVAEWEVRLTPLALAAGEISPPARVWQALAQRIAGAARGTGWWASLGFWRGLAVTSTAFVLVLASFIGVAPRPEPPMATVAVMSDEKAQPAMVVSWQQMKTMREPHIRVKILQDHPTMAAGTAWELWMLPGGDQKPVSLGLVGTEPTQELTIPQKFAALIDGAWGLAMSVEPGGGSPTGLPTGPVLYKGQCTKL